MGKALLFLSAIFATSSASIDLCMPGSFSPNGTSPCSPCPPGTAAGVQSDPGLRFFGFGAPDASAAQAGIILNSFLPSPDTAAVRVYPLVCRGYCSMRLGVLDASGAIINTDDYFATAVFKNEVYGQNRFTPKLDSASGWASPVGNPGSSAIVSPSSSSNLYLEVRVPSSDITSIVTQGRSSFDQWTTSYALHYRARGSTVWRDLGTFPGNSDRNTKVTHRIEGLSGPIAPGSSGWVEEGLAFDGVDDSVELPSWELGGATSVEAYVRYARFNSYSRMIDFGNGADDENLILQNVEETGTCRWWFDSNNYVSAENCFVINEWVHIVATVSDAGVMKLYKNGELVGTEANGLVPNTLTRLHHYVGQSNWADGNNFDGVIRYVGVYDREVVYRDAGITTWNVGLAGAFSLDICEMVPPGYSLCSNGVWDATACSLVAPGYYNDGSGTQPCPSGRWSSLVGLSASGGCDRCPAGKWSSATGLSSICEDSCPPGKWSSLVGLTSEDSCEGQNCPAGTYSTFVGVSKKADCENRDCFGVAYYCPAGSSAPLEVSPNHYTTPEDNFLYSRTGQSPCPVGEFCGGGVRSLVPPGYYVDNNDIRLVCPEGSYCTNNEKRDCSPGSYCEVGSSIDRPCLAGFFCPSPIEKVECNEGQYCPEGVQTPGACPAGETAINGEGFSFCIKCEPGKFRSSDENTDATATREDLLCADCTQGKRSGDDGTQCEPCDAPGEYSPNNGSAFCKVAPAGYEPNEDRTRVLPCRPGFYSGGGDATSCKMCEIGKFNEAQASAFCLDCLPGSKNNGTGATECELCLDGEFQDKAGQTSCKMCDPIAGSVDREGSLACSPCKPGQYVGEDSTCRLCAAGKISDGGSTKSCEACPPGTSSEEGAFYCRECKAGTFLNASTQPPVCDRCPPGEISKAASTKCTKCGIGTWESNHTDCFACVAGRYGAEDGLNNSKCSGTCPPGKHSYRYAEKCLDCEPGKHAPNAGMEECILCEQDEGLTSLANAIECVCDVGKFRSPEGACEACKEGMECASIGVDVGSVSLKEGFWRKDTTTDNVISCPYPDACAGSNDTCAEGNEGVLCAVCSQGYYRPSPLSACEVCDSSEAAAYGSLVGGVIVIALCLWAILLLNRYLPSGLLRPFISFVQNMSILLLFDAPFPKTLVDLFKVVGSLDLGLDLVWPSCFIDLNFYASLAVLSSATFAILLGLSTPFLYTKIKEGISWKDAANTPMGQRAIKDCFVIVLLIYPGLSGKSMQFFRCQEVDGVSYLVADYSLICYESTWWGMLPVALVLLIGVALGTPILFIALLYRNRHNLYDPVTKRANEQPLNVICRPYRPGAWYFESVSMLFKVGLWFALVYFTSGSTEQFLVACALNMSMLCVIIGVLPMGSRDARVLNTLQVVISVLLVSLAVGGSAMNALETTEMLARSGDASTKESAEHYSDMVKTIQTMLEAFSMALLVSLCLFGFTKMYRKLPGNSRAKRGIDSFLRLVHVGGVRGTVEDGEINTEMTTNPMRQSNALPGGGENGSKSQRVAAAVDPTV